MKKSIMAVLALAAAVVHAENVVYGVGALAESSNTVGAVAIGREALGSADGASDTVAVGNYAALGAKNCGTTIAIGKGALVGVENVNRTVAIGAYEMFGESGQDDTTSINSKQLWVSKPLDAFCINPAKSLHITNTPLYYIGGEIHMQADVIRMSSKGGSLTGKRIAAEEMTFPLEVHAVCTNILSLGYGPTHIYIVTNCVVSARLFPQENDYEIASLSIAVHARAFDLVRNYPDTELVPLYNGEDIVTYNYMENIPLKAGTSFDNGRISISSDYSALCRVSLTDTFGREPFTTDINVTIPLHRVLQDQMWDPILHQRPQKGESHALVSSAGVHDFVDSRLGGLTFRLENGGITVCTNGVAAGRIPLTAN